MDGGFSRETGKRGSSALKPETRVVCVCVYVCVCVCVLGTGMGNLCWWLQIGG